MGTLRRKDRGEARGNEGAWGNGEAGERRLRWPASSPPGPPDSAAEDYKSQGLPRRTPEVSCPRVATERGGGPAAGDSNLEEGGTWRGEERAGAGRPVSAKRVREGPGGCCWWGRGHGGQGGSGAAPGSLGQRRGTWPVRNAPGCRSFLEPSHPRTVGLQGGRTQWPRRPWKLSCC